MFKMIYLDCIASSNDYILERLDILPPNSVIVAKSQTAGKGTNGRVWLSPIGNLYFSMYKQLPYTQAQLQYLSINVAVKIAQVLLDFGVNDIGIKWPNDLILKQKKLGGILIETRNSRKARYTDVIIGVGLNIVMQNDLDISQPYTSLANEGYNLDAHVLLQEILLNINTASQLGVD
jgi:BirA family biotin operon repressor/biotin-[acetyl-CoA-carboxylase] ligase